MVHPRTAPRRARIEAATSSATAAKQIHDATAEVPASAPAHPIGRHVHGPPSSPGSNASRNEVSARDTTSWPACRELTGDGTAITYQAV